ncbi:MAG TPA: tyrosine-type recombinase/integrase [Pseudonocardiaceae bacterium]|nr:tyrosine-type recombinase/integrase [Pseudonocardiaceae bacterium]
MDRGRLRCETTRREGFHQLRQYCASVMLADGASIPELAAIMGHHDPGYTLRVYGHLLPNSFERLRKSMDRRMFRPRAVANRT